MSTPFYDLASLVVVPSGYKSGKIYAQKPLTTDGQLTFTRASTATRVNASGLIESVASGVPRLDYTNSSCPKILLEPQRTQYCKQPINLADGTVWSNELSVGTSLTYTATGGPSGAGYSTITGSTAGGRVVQATATTFANATFSVYLRKKSSAHTGNITLSMYTAPVGNSLSINASQLTSSWQRFSVSTTGGAVAYSDWSVYAYDSVDFEVSCVQFEDGAYATSFIPATTATVTRLADAASKTGISSLIGQTEGTVFVDWTTTGSITSAGSYFTFLVSGTSGNLFYVALYGDGRAQAAIFVGNTIQANIITSTGYITGANNKLAFAYKNNDFVFYVNGVQIGTDTSGSVPATTDINLADTSGGSMKYNQALLFKTRLTNAQLAELTTL